MFGFNSGIKEVDPSQFAQWANDTTHKMRVIDVRQMAEIASGTVPKAEAFPLHLLPAKVGELSPQEKLVVVCRSGARSMQACMFLHQQGFKEVYNLSGGMMGWVGSGFPVHHLG